MKYSFGVLLLKLADESNTPFGADYANHFFTRVGQGTRNLVDFYLDMSHGQADLGDSEVFGWLDVAHTSVELIAFHRQVKTDEIKRLNDNNNSLPDAQQLSKKEIEEAAAVTAQRERRFKIQEWAFQAAADAKPEPVSLTRFVTIVAVFSAPIDYFGSPDGVVVNFNPSNEEMNSVDLTGVAHEIGHSLGLTHSRREGSTMQYGDRWDIMSAYDAVYYNHAGSTNEDPDRPYHTYGPGLNAVNMQIAGWLDMSRIYQFPTTGAWQVTLRPLHRRDLPGYLAAQVRNFWIEFRMPEFWDSALDRPVVLLHRKDINDNGLPCSMLVVPHRVETGLLGGGQSRPDMRDGETFEVGNEMDLDSDFLRISVAINVEGKEAAVSVVHRPARQLEPSLPFGAVASDGGGLIWMPGRGWVRVPPRSPLYSIVEQVAEIEQLQTMLAIPGQQVVINGMTTQRLTNIRKNVSRIIANREAPRVPIASLSGTRDER